MTDMSVTKSVRRMPRMPAEGTAAGADKAIPQATAPGATTQRPATKISLVIRLLERVEGASLEEMVSAATWLAHNTRTALTGLKKKGKVITMGSHSLKGKVRYRYYVTRPGLPDGTEAWRVSAYDLEALVCERRAALLEDQTSLVETHGCVQLDTRQTLAALDAGRRIAGLLRGGQARSGFS